MASMVPPLIVDAHEDLAWNILTFGRDYTRSVAETRQLESGGDIPAHNGETLLGWSEYQRGRVAIVFGTLFAAPAHHRSGDWDTQVYADMDEAHHHYHAQLGTYLALVERHPDHFCLVQTALDLEKLLSQWSTADAHPVGLVVSMEGAEGIRTPAELGNWWKGGVRLIGLAWAGTRFSGGTREPGPLTQEGRDLLAEMARFGFTLDLSHMDEQAAWQCLDIYPGPVISSHANAAALLENYQGNRQLSDALIQGIVARRGIMGVVPYCRFLRTGWMPSDGRSGLTLETVADHIDHVCQLAGDASHVGIGSDFDGGFGLNAVPADVDTIADLQKLSPILARRGYAQEDIAAVLGGNWLRFLSENLPGG